MHSSHSFLICVLAAAVNVNAYTLVQTYDASNFKSEFSFFTAPDPTLGFVEYVGEAVASSGSEDAGQTLFTVSNNQIYLGVDHTEIAPSGGRESVRVSSNQAFTQGVFLADISHMPVGCGTWPAYWMFGPNWPNSGEIDIIEGVNQQATNQIDLHTGPGCTVTNEHSLPGTQTLQTNCNLNGGGTGCGASTSNTNAFGAGFNAVGGGVYAMQWATSGIYVWFFQRGSIPPEVAAGEVPNVQSWGVPMVTFSSGSDGGCDFDAAFKNHNIVFDTTFCGQWAGAVWGSSSCASQASSCNEFVANNPGAFADAYWLINSIKVYQ